MIIRARSVVTMDSAAIHNGAVAVSGGLIRDVGRFEEVRRRNAGEVLDLRERALLPGLINAHCHLDYTALRGSIPRQSSFTAWIRAINDRKAALTADDYRSSIAGGLREAVSFGTTAVVNLEAFPRLLGGMSSPPLRTWWCAEMFDVRGPVSPREVYAKMREDLGSNRDERSGLGLAPHAPFTASAALYRDCAGLAAKENLLITTHLAESREEMQMFRGAEGALFEFMETIGRPMQDCGKLTPLALLLEEGILSERWLISHLNELTADDFRLLEAAPKFHIVHCPRSHAQLGHSPFPLERLRALGFNICVGTDSLASNDDLSLFRELRHLARIEPALSAGELFEMVTTRAAAALGQSRALGRIRVGFSADLIAVPSNVTGAGLFDELLAFDDVMPWMMIDGEPLASS